MAKGSDRRAGSFEIEQSGGGALSGLLAEEEEFDRRAFWRLGTWAAAAVGAVIIAILANQSSIGARRELTASADLARQAHQLQTAAKDSLSETRRLAAAVETLNGDRDRLYSRVAVLEQGLDSVTGTIVRQNSTPSPSPSIAPVVPPTAASSPPPSVAAASPSTAPAPQPPTASASEPPPVLPKPATASSAPAPAVAPVTSTAAAATEKPSPKPAAPEPAAAQASVSAPAPPPAPTQPMVSLMAPKSMMGPPDAAATKLVEPPAASKLVAAAPTLEATAAIPKTPENEASSEISATVPELAAKRTEFGVDVGGANSIPGLRALWRGLLKSKANAALTTLHPIIVIKENSNGLGMQLRLVAGPISDAAAAARICATLTVSDRSCTTAVFEGQRLVINSEEQAKAEAQPAPEATSAIDAKPTVPKTFSNRHHSGRHSLREEAPKAEQPSTLSLIFGKRDKP